ncbi:MAG: 50S ribosomal protein L23 [Candidatus Lloydbacteria bacterium RIFCSPHIGHO2_01_FULL_49_22]|uniref:50S ribosomal protein L23 n=1 Tax=Candidatus Lloydbacteria bacterium RIFCSPHIGHO2_01_FULL_49_22 TaxID=1798658 RepID=A0A1G2CYB1_9BACT|nr:MAG: 50S ribosomal protein L23 [Candidatus Lloydbacteria bacterium RIFCSPHIGHO2_01_FULL_49_22]OGZ09422.1 MAG: 50S ribosomal protein L23 [Candidatus Lloydbacteria bacterium RIFCSPHIGHO2_02_FULL_50_18]
MILVRPHITEKATDLSEHNVYAFEIARMANKAQVRQAIEKFYKVKPVKIAIIMGIAKYMKNPRTGRMQTKKIAIKKALVYLKKGDKIEFV